MLCKTDYMNKCTAKGCCFIAGEQFIFSLLHKFTTHRGCELPPPVWRRCWLYHYILTRDNKVTRKSTFHLNTGLEKVTREITYY